MKIHNVVRNLALIGAAAALLPMGSALAAGPGFDGIVVNANTTGTLSGCPAAATSCNVLIDGADFMQQEVVFGADTFIQTVIIDPLAAAVTSNTDVRDLAFSDITFIQLSGTSNGIAGLQTMVDDPNDGSGNIFEASSELSIGAWADNSPVDLQIQQSFRDNSNTGVAIGSTTPSQVEDDFESSFILGINLDANGVAIGKKMDIIQDVGMTDPNAATTPINDFQRFVVRQRSGDLLLTSGTLTLAENPTSPATTGGTVTWAASDNVMVAWLGQSVGLGGLGASTFGFESIENMTSSATASTFSADSTDVTLAPFDWDTHFGDAPTMPTP